MTEKELAEEINKWFSSTIQPTPKSNRNFWNRNLVGKAIKSNLKKWHHWKDRAKTRNIF